MNNSSCSILAVCEFSPALRVIYYSGISDVEETKQAIKWRRLELE